MAEKGAGIRAKAWASLDPTLTRRMDLISWPTVWFGCR